MTNYDEVAGWGEMIAEVVREQRMPPWHADPKFGVFSNDARLSAEEIELVSAWVETGCPEGDPADLPEPRQVRRRLDVAPRAGPADRLHERKTGRRARPKGSSPTGTTRSIRALPRTSGSSWPSACPATASRAPHHRFRPAAGIEARAAARRRTSRGSSFLAGFAPGTRPLVLPAGHGQEDPGRLEAGLPDALHAQRLAADRPQQRRADLRRQGRSHAPGGDDQHGEPVDFAIPPHDPNYTVEAEATFPRDTSCCRCFRTCTCAAKSFRYERDVPRRHAARCCSTCRSTTSTGRTFILAEPKLMPKGTKCTARPTSTTRRTTWPTPIPRRSPLGPADVGRNDDRLVRRLLSGRTGRGDP